MKNLKCNKNLKMSALIWGLVALSIAAGTAAAADYSVTSPDGKLSLVLRNPAEAKGQLQYSVTYVGKSIISPSRIDVQLAKPAGLMESVKVVNATSKNVKQTHTPPYGQRDRIADNYTQTTFDLVGQAKVKFQLVVRAYDNGVAFRYIIPAQDGLKKIAIARELTEFRMDPSGRAWFSTSSQGHIKPTSVSKLPNGCDRPLVVELPNNGPTIALGEAGLIDSSRTKFNRLKDRKGVITAMNGGANFTTSWRSPFRYILVAPNSLKMLERGYDTIWCLNDPCKIKDTSFIKPGKVLREITLTTAGAKATIDFCKRHNIRYCHFDAGWYGYEYTNKSDATTVTVDPRRSKGPLALQEVIQYAKDNGVGVIVYVNRRALERQLDKLLPLYKKWGIAGIKFGFVNVGSQHWTKWLHQSIAKCAKYGMVVNVHDEYRSTGVERTWPNLLTWEGVHGDEGSPPMWMAINTAFVRNLGGPADHTYCYFDSRVRKRLGNHAGQLAKSVVIYSPLQYIYWYDKPAKAAELGGKVAGNEKRAIDESLPELKFWDVLPTTWDETKVLDGQIGQHITVARRKGKTWFVGILSAGKGDREIKLPMSFLSKGKTYTATIYRNDPSVKTATKVRVEQKKSTAQSVLNFTLKGNDGVAIQLTEAN